MNTLMEVFIHYIHYCKTGSFGGNFAWLSGMCRRLVIMSSSRSYVNLPGNLLANGEYPKS